MSLESHLTRGSEEDIKVKAKKKKEKGEKKQAVLMQFTS